MRHYNKLHGTNCKACGKFIEIIRSRFHVPDGILCLSCLDKKKESEASKMEHQYIDTNCLWCKKPFRTELIKNLGRDDTYKRTCSNECRNAYISFKDQQKEQKRLKHEARLTPTYHYRKIMKALANLHEALTGDECFFTEEFGIVSNNEIKKIVIDNFATETSGKYYNDFKKIKEWKYPLPLPSSSSEVVRATGMSYEQQQRRYLLHTYLHRRWLRNVKRIEKLKKESET